MSSSIQHLEKELDSTMPEPEVDQDSTETVALKTVKADRRKSEPPKFTPPSGRKRSEPAVRTDTVSAAAFAEKTIREPEHEPSADPYTPKPLLSPSLPELLGASLPTIFSIIGLLILVLVSILFHQIELVIILSLTTIAVIGWRVAVFDWIPADTLVRSIETGYGYHVIRIVQGDEVNNPVRLIHKTSDKYVVWYALPGRNELGIASMMIADCRFTLMTSDNKILPSIVNRG